MLRKVLVTFLVLLMVVGGPSAVVASIGAGPAGEVEVSGPGEDVVGWRPLSLEGDSATVADLRQAATDASGPDGAAVPADMLVPSGRTGPDMVPRNITFNDTNPHWFGYSVGTVGMVTSIEVWITNIGTDNATDVDVRIEIRDYFDNVVGLKQGTVPDVPPGVDVLVTWDDWTPAHSAKVHAFVELTTVGDVDTSNDRWTVYGDWWVNKWMDDASSEVGWTGDLSASMWHISDSITTDPAPWDHTSPEAWYAGTESPVGDFYTANMNASLISPSIDLTRMNPYYPVFLNFKYYGVAIAGDGLSMYISTDNGASWVDTRTRITGLTTVDGQPDWVVRVDNWIDTDNDGIRETGEFAWGLDMSEFIGEHVRFKFTFRSGPTSTGLGYYLDDLIVYGFEAADEISLVRIENLGTTHVDENEDIVATFWNQGTAQSPDLTARMTVLKGSDEIHSQDVSVGQIPAGGSGQASFSHTFNETGDFKVEVELLDPPGGKDSSYFNNKQTRRVHVSTGKAGVLLVDDDGGKTNSGRLPYGSYEVDTDYLLVSAIDAELDVHHVLYNDDGPDASVLGGYHTVIWSTGWDGTGRTVTGTLTPTDRDNLRTYLGSGGSLWLISQEAVFDLMDAAPGFLEDQLHVSDHNDDAGTPGTIDGVDGSEITEGMSFPAVVRIPANDRADSIAPDAVSEGILFQDENVQNPSTGPFNGIAYNGSYKLVYTSFEHSALVNDQDRADLADAVLDWLYSGLSMEMASTRKTVEAGGTANYTVRITNHGSVNKTVRELVVAETAATWSATVSPKVTGGAPETVLQGFTTLNAYLLVKAPAGLPAGTEGRVKVRLVVDETGETFENATYTTIRETVRMNMTVSPSGQSAERGKNASYLVSLRNVGNVKVSVNMSLNGTIDTWASLDPAFLVLDQDETKGIVLTISVPMDAPAGNSTLEVVAEGRYRNLVESTVGRVNVTVNQFHGLAIRSVRAPYGGQVDPSELVVDIVVELDNLGNGEDDVTVSLSGVFQDEENWQWGFKKVAVPAFSKGFRTNVSLGVWDQAMGGRYNITARADSEDGRSYAESFIILTLMRPDLYVTTDGVTFDYDLVVGQEVSFKVKVFNGGHVDSPVAGLTVYDRSKEVIFTGTTGTGIKGGGFTEVTVQWRPEFRGPEELEIVVNEEETIIEMDFENNTVIKSVLVQQPNLQVGEAELQFFVDGKDKDSLKVGDQVSITVQVRNMDDYSYRADDVSVEFYLDGSLIGNKTVDIKADNIAYVRVEWKATKGTHTISVKVDPDDRIDEAKEDDNEVQRSVRVTEKAGAGLAFDPLWVGIVVTIAIVVGIGYAMARGAIPSPFKQSRVEIADKNYKCNECGKKIKKGRELYHCSCGARSHVKCAKKAELCECLKRVRIDD